MKIQLTFLINLNSYKRTSEKNRESANLFDGLYFLTNRPLKSRKFVQFLYHRPSCDLIETRFLFDQSYLTTLYCFSELTTFIHQFVEHPRVVHHGSRSYFVTSFFLVSTFT